MDAFDQLPDRRKPRTNSLLATQSPFTFASMEDTPRGAMFQRTRDGFEASAPVRNWLMGLLFGGMSIFLTLLLIGGFSQPDTPLGFVIVLGGGLVVSLPLLLFYLFGREGIAIQGEQMKLRKTFLGVGIPKSMAWRTIERVQVRRRKATQRVASIGPMQQRLPMGNSGGLFLEIESATHIKKMGSNLSDEHLYYIRYLIIEAVKASRAKGR